MGNEYTTSVPKCEKCYQVIAIKPDSTTTEEKLRDDGTLYYLYGEGPFCVPCLKRGVTVKWL